MPLCIVTPSNDKKDKQNDLAKDNKNKKKEWTSNQMTKVNEFDIAYFKL